jgi:hypothetical protein
MRHTVVAQPRASISCKAAQHSTGIFAARLKAGPAALRRCIAHEGEGADRGAAHGCADRGREDSEDDVDVSAAGRLIMRLPE